MTYAGPTRAIVDHVPLVTLWLLELMGLLLVFAALLMGVILIGGSDLEARVRDLAGGYAIVLIAVGVIAIVHVRHLGRSLDPGPADDLPAPAAEPPHGLQIAETVQPRGWPPVSSLNRAPRRERPAQARAIANATVLARRSMPRAVAARPTPASRVPVAARGPSVAAARPYPVAIGPSNVMLGPRGASPMTRPQLAALQIGAAGPWRPRHRSIPPSRFALLPPYRGTGPGVGVSRA